MLFLYSDKKVKTYSKYYTKIFKSVNKNFFGYFNYLHSKNNIFQANLFINTSKSIERQKGAILEEITQSIGLGNDSYLYPTSIFYEPKIDEQVFITKNNSFDRKIIKLLYHPRLKVGMNRLKTESNTRKIINSNEI